LIAGLRLLNLAEVQFYRSRTTEDRNGNFQAGLLIVHFFNHTVKVSERTVVNANHFARFKQRFRTRLIANLLQAVPMLMAQAEVKGGPHGDNLSVVAIRWEESPEDSESSISTQTMALHEVATQMEEFGRTPAYKGELSDDEIEKAIEEIRSAIEKYNPKKPGQ
jgi:hypothetical protein